MTYVLFEVCLIKLIFESLEIRELKLTEYFYIYTRESNPVLED